MVSFIATISGGTPDQQSSVRRSIQAAGEAWSRHLAGPGEIEIAATIKPLADNVIASARAALTVLQADGLYQEGPAYEIETGTDPNGTLPDLEINFDPDRFFSRDGTTITIHEIGHGLAFNGFFAGPYRTVYESLIAGSPEAPLFTGTAAQAIYGRPVPMAADSAAHYAVNGMMNPVYQGPAQLSALDLAIARDSGLMVKERFGTIGDDTMPGTADADIVYGGYGNDVMEGNQAADTLYGWAGEDTLFGGRDADLLIGGDGNDVLYGGRGDDTLVGGGGSDLFVFGDDQGVKHIADWQFDIGDPGKSDRLQFSSAPSVSVDYASYSVTYVAAGTTVILDHTITILPEWVAIA